MTNENGSRPIPPNSKPRPSPIPKSSSSEPDPFASLPAFDPDRFKPPSWASDPSYGFSPLRDNDKLGESSKSAQDRHGFGINRSDEGAEGANGSTKRREEGVDDAHDDDEESLGLSEQEEVWEDAVEEVDMGLDENGEFRLDELRRLLDKASKLKTEGNAHFTTRPPRSEEAIQAYKSALGYLPKRPESDTAATDTPLPSATDTSASTTPANSSLPVPQLGASGIQELTESEAAQLEAELSRQPPLPADEERQKTEGEEKDEIWTEIEELKKACWGNLGAVYLGIEGKEAECVEACKEALKIDPKYTKALQRRATANERIGSWSALTAAQEDYTSLLSLLPPSHPSIPAIRKSLTSLPGRIKLQQEKEKDEMLGKLKDLGNGILGRFGLSTDMFKFDQQEGGGYSMRFER